MPEAGNNSISKAGKTGNIRLVFAAIFFGFILVLVADQFIPNVDRFRVPANEASAVGTLRTPNELERGYSAGHPDKGFACELSQFRPLAPDSSTHNEPFATGTRSGYRFALTSCHADARGMVSSYHITAVPLQPRISGLRAFCTGEAGVSYDESGSAEKCLTSGRSLD